ncbi:UDP-N-acetylglucosamine--N-acetylmuramyl-(pentapeptide) pyrophosphoryl-undecaprenol N-acetylglucosamine transferase [Candidatus Shapirobacteria bacterium]|nr:UDP-N-acetylglucosamine--N-acetylmuramyl-(pentapeptide) pyrophosphoryl-undecaprenol N-acetylglucosamine transferase [Candidatus Shapirobacteria bacterium]
MRKKRIVLTGGHLTPALAVIEELQKKGWWEVYYFGRPYSTEGDKTPSLESQMIKKVEVNFIPINFGRFQHHFTRYTLPALIRIPWGFLVSFYRLFRLKPDVVLSFGSYVGATVAFAAWWLSIPVVIHEQTTVFGLANRLSQFWAKKIFVSWPETLRFLPREKTLLTGNPLRSEIFRASPKIWSSFQFDQKLPLILITGGNQGSHRINLAMEGILEKLLKEANVFHQCGQLQIYHDFQRLSAKRNQLAPLLKKRYQLKKYVTGQEWGTLLQKADLVISRAGINIITELLTLGKTQLLIPIPWLPGDEQTKNAQMVKRMGSGEILPQDELTPTSLFNQIKKMMKKIKTYQKAPKLINRQAAGKIVHVLEKMV